jgi:predicted  nucleic acid-binding Zn-ribbon protein
VNTQPKPKPCAQCGSIFTPVRPMMRVCGPLCASRLVKAAKKEESARTKARKVAIKSRADWAREAQTAFNAWVRARDADKPCISCQRHHTGQYHAGHLLSRGARPELAYEPDNCHKQCAPCNTHLSGNVSMYRVNLVKLIGLERVEWLEGPHPAKHYSIEDLRAVSYTHLRAHET